MAHRLGVRVDLERVRSNLSREDQEVKSRDEVRQFLIDSGFIEHGEFWIGSEEDLGQLDPSEVLEVWDVDHDIHEMN